MLWTGRSCRRRQYCANAPWVPQVHQSCVRTDLSTVRQVQLELVQRFRPRLPPEAINFLTVYTNDVAQIAVPPENRAEHVVKLVERQLIGDRDQADDHRAHLAQNRSQNQAFEGGCFNHLSRLLGSRPPTFWRSPESAESPAKTPTVVHPLSPEPVIEPEPPPSSSGGTGGKGALKQGSGFRSVLVAGGLIYLAIRVSQAPPPQPAPIAAVTPTPPVIATPTIEEKDPPTPDVAVQLSAKSIAPVAVAIPSPSISVNHIFEIKNRS